MNSAAIWTRSLPQSIAVAMLFAWMSNSVQADETTLVFDAVGDQLGHVVLVAGDEEYRSEETMPMLGKILSQKHGFKCTVVFSLSKDGSYIDPNHSAGLKGLAALNDADLMIIGTRFRQPSEEEAAHLTKFMDAGKPIIGIRTATHAFNGKGDFGGKIGFGEWGRKILGEQWVNHHGRHKVQGARGVKQTEFVDHPVVNSVEEIFAFSDVYGVVHLTDDDKILMRAAVTESLQPDSKNIDGEKNDPMQPFVWLHTYESPAGKTGTSMCTTAGASVDMLNESLRRLIVNGVYFLTGHDVPAKADVDFVDPYHPSFYGFINDGAYWQDADLQPSDFALGKSPQMPDPKGTPQWQFETAKAE